MITHPGNNYFYVIESDNRVWGEDAAEKKLAELVRTYVVHCIASARN